jgi:hypothetical protein
MALITRVISNAGDPIVDAEGNPIEGVSISFQLVNQNRKPTDAWDTETGEYVAPTRAYAVTDVNGEFSIDLWPNDRGWYTTSYYCVVGLYGSVPFLTTLPSGALDTFAWIDFMKQGVPADLQTVTSMQTYWEETLAARDATLAAQDAITILITSTAVTDTIFVDASVDPLQTLPLSGVVTRYFKSDSTAAHVTFDCTVGRTIEGQNSYDGLSVQNESITFGLFDTDWKVIG